MQNMNKISDREMFSPPKASKEGQHQVNGHFEKAKGLNWVVTGLFVVGDLAGGGLVALPTAMIQTGIVLGLILNVLMAMIKAYTAFLLGRCWVMLQQGWPEEYASEHCRKPYPEIGNRALGPRMKTFVSICIDITQFGISVVFLLLSAKNINDFLKAFFNFDFGFCLLIIVVALLLLPLTFLKSPQDFWGAVVLAMFTTSMAVVLIVIGASLDYGTCAAARDVPPIKFTNVFLAFGTLLFAYGGHACIPTIQHDMRKPHEFTKSSILAFSMIASMYIPVCIMGFVTYGGSIRDSIINSVQLTWIQQGVNMFITLHCILTLTIVFNPLMQEAEEIFKVPQQFCLKRVIVRSGVMCAVVFVAETFPTFGPLLDLVGSSTMTMTSLIFPCLFYLYLSNQGRRTMGNQIHSIKLGLDNPPMVMQAQDLEYCSIRDIIARTDRKTLFICSAIIIVGVVGGGAAACSAIREISFTKFVPPCYFSLFLNEEIKVTGLGNTHCCGAGQNITRYGDPNKYCADPKLGLYD